MKLVTISLIFLFCQIEAISQIVLTSATNGAVLGNKRLLYYNWSVNQGYYKITADYTDKWGTIWDYHDMTILLSEWLENRYCGGDSTKMTTLEGKCAIHTNDYIISAYNTKDTLMKFPLKYGDHFTSVYENNLPFKYASRSVEVDAVGKLILPHSTYNEALRIKTTHNYIDSTHPNKFIKERRITYRWYSPITREYLLVIDSAFVTENYPQNISSSVYSGFTSMFPLSVETNYQNSLISLYPNPSKKTIYINTSYKTMQVLVKDITGKIILSFNEKPTAIEFDNPGIYFVTIVADTNISTQKVTITR